MAGQQCARPPANSPDGSRPLQPARLTRWSRRGLVRSEADWNAPIRNRRSDTLLRQVRYHTDDRSQPGKAGRCSPGEEQARWISCHRNRAHSVIAVHHGTAARNRRTAPIVRDREISRHRHPLAPLRSSACRYRSKSPGVKHVVDDQHRPGLCGKARLEAAAGIKRAPP